jgi:hypothetical protein
MFGGKEKEVLIRVYDAAGKIVLSERKANAAPLPVATGSLARGTYWLVVSDGVTMKTGQFVKQ